MPVTSKPTIHLNGSARKTLFEGYANAAGDIRKAIESVRQTAPHGRDYYIQTEPEKAWKVAEAEHRARLGQLEAVMKELYELAHHVADAPGPGKL